MNKYYFSSDKLRFAIFKGKCIISKEGAKMNLWEISGEKIHQLWVYSVFPPNFIPIVQYLDDYLFEPWVSWETDQFARSLLFPGIAGGADRLCLVPSHTTSACEQESQRNS